MAGQFELLYVQGFSSVSSVTVTHNLDRLQVGVIARIGNTSRNDLIYSITPSISDPRNEVVVTFVGTQSGEILISDTDYTFANIPTPEDAAQVSQLTSSAYSPGGADTQVQFNDGGSSFSGSSNFVWLKASNTLSVDGAISGSGIISGSAFYGDGSSLTGIAAGSDTQVQFRDAGGFAADVDFTWNKTTNILTLGGVSGSGNISGSAFYGDGSNLTNLPAGSPAGTNTQIQFNNAGAFGASTSLTFNGTDLRVIGNITGSGVISGSAFYGDGTNLGNIIPESTVDAKGDLLAATADNTVARLAVGSNNDILTADSSQSTGVRWATPAEPVYVDYYDAATTSVGTSATTLGLDTSRQSNALFVLSSDQVTVQTAGGGDYFIRYDVTFRETDNDNREIECWMEINGTEVTATRSVYSHWDEHGLTTDSTAGRSVIITLSDGDVIRLRGEVTNGNAGYTTDTGGVSLQVFSIGSNGTQGPTGAQGPTGSGSTITVEDEGSIVSGGPHSNLDFVGAGVTATDAGSGVATITITGGSANIAQYRQTGNLTINTSATTVVLNANDFEDSNYTRSGANITINTAGVYQISYQVYYDTNANARRTVDAWVENNTVEIVPSRAASYSRNTTDDTASSGATFLVQLAASDVVRLRAQSTGTSGTVIGQGNRMWIAIQFVRAP